MEEYWHLCGWRQLIFGVSASDKPVASTSLFLIILCTCPLHLPSISFIFSSYRQKLIEQLRFPLLLSPSPSAHICHFFSRLLSFTFSYDIFFLICYYITFLLALTIKPTGISSTTFFLHFHPFFAVFPKPSNFIRRGCINYKATVYRHIIQSKKMFSSGGRAPACKHDIKAMMRRIDSDRHTALNSHRVEARGNLHMGSPYKNATPGRTHSKSRQKKLSANKLFSKAHQISDNETYLTHSKSNEPYHAKQTRSNSGHCSDCLHTKKTKVLELCQQFNIKVGGEVDNNTLSLIIEKYGFYGITIDDLSSIHQNSDDSTLTSESTSLIDLIVKS